jgi:hypothetical protein
MAFHDFVKFMMPEWGKYVRIGKAFFEPSNQAKITVD